MFDVKDGIQISKSVVINKDKDVFAKKVTASGGAVINTGSWNKDGLRLNGAAPSIYFSQDDGSNAYLGLNGDNFYVLPDTDSNGTYSSPYVLQASFSGSDFRYFGHRVFHEGHKPTLGELGAAAASHSHSEYVVKSSNATLNQLNINDYIDLPSKGEGRHHLLRTKGQGGIYQITDRGGIMLTSADDSLVLANGDVGRNFALDSSNFNFIEESMYLLSDTHLVIKTDLQEGFGTEQNMIFTNEGRLGVRTLSPSRTLDVNGDVNTNGNLYVEAVNYASNQLGGVFLEARNSTSGWSKQRHGIFLKSDSGGSSRVSVDTSDVEVMAFSSSTGATALNGLRAAGSNQLQLRPTTGSNVPTVIHRNDSNDYYILLSNAGSDFNSNFNGLRPFNINLTTGKLNSANGQYFSGGTGLGGALDMNNNDIVGVGAILHEGDTNTYMQFHDADKWRVVTGGSQRLEVNNSSTVIGNTLDLNGRLDAYGVNHTNNIRIDDNNADQTLNAINIDYNVSGSQALTTTRFHHAHLIDVDFTANGDQTNGENRVYGHTIDVDVGTGGRLRRAYGLNADVRTSADAGNAYQIIGANNSADNETRGTANANDTMGSFSQGYFGSTSSTASNSLYGAYNIGVYSSNATSRINNVHGSRNEVQIDNNTVTSGEKIGNIYATQSVIDQNDADGGVKATNSYLFWGQYEGTAANNQWGVYINNDVPSLFKGEVIVENPQPWLQLNDTTGSNMKIRNQSSVLYFDDGTGTGNATLDTGPIRADSLFLADSSGPYFYQSNATHKSFSVRTGVSGSYKFLTFRGDNGQLELGGQQVWHAGNDGSGSGLDADKLDGLHASNLLRSDASDTYARNTGMLSFDMVGGERATSTGSRSPLEVRNPNSTGDAFMQFHVSGRFAAYFGIDRDINDFFVGGYSMGNVRHRVWHDGNRTKFTPGTAFDLGTEDLNSFNTDDSAGFYYQQANNRTPGKNYPAELAGSLLVQKSAKASNTGSTQLYITYNNSDMYFRGLYGNTPAWRKVWHDGNDGAGSGLDADKLDGLHESTFMRRSANSNLDMNNNGILGVSRLTHEGDDNTFMEFPNGDQWRVVTGGAERLLVNNGSTNVRNDLRVDQQILTTQISTSNGTQLVLNAGEAAGKFSGQNGEFVYANAEQGLLVTTPDRAHANFSEGYTADVTTIRGDAIFVKGNEVFHDGRLPQTLASQGNRGAETGRNGPGGIYTYNARNVSLGNSTPTAYYSVMGWGQGTDGSAQLAASWTNNGNELFFRSLRDTTDNWFSWKKIWHEGNDGAGSGLHADLLDGYHATSSGDPNTVVVRNGSADINARLFRSTYASQSTPSDTADIAFRNNDTNDNYIRFTDRVGIMNYIERGDRFATKANNKSNSLADGAWIAAYVDDNNRDHIYHDEGTNTWHFVSDSPFKSLGNSTIQCAITKCGRVDIAGGDPSIRFAKTGFNDYGGIRFGAEAPTGGTNNNGGMEFWTSDDYSEPFVWNAYDTGAEGAGVHREWMRLDNGGLNVYGNLTGYNTSDERLKDNMQVIPDALGKTSILAGYSFNWNGKQSYHEVGMFDYGLKAQEVQKVLPAAVKEREGYLVLNYEKVIPLLVNAVNELKKENDAVKAENRTLRATLDSVLARLDVLENR